MTCWRGVRFLVTLGGGIFGGSFCCLIAAIASGNIPSMPSKSPNWVDVVFLINMVSAVATMSGIITLCACNNDHIHDRNNIIPVHVAACDTACDTIVDVNDDPRFLPVTDPTGAVTCVVER